MTVILNSRKIVFIHIAKNAGMFVSKVLFDIGGDRDFFVTGPSGQFKNSRFLTRFHKTLGKLGFASMDRLHKHSSAEWILESYPKLSDYQLFAVLRDPLERAVSMYKYALFTKYKMPEQPLQDAFVKIRKEKTFDNFSIGLQDYIYIDNFFKPQSFYIKDKFGKNLVNYLFTNKKLLQQMNCLFKDIKSDQYSHPINQQNFYVEISQLAEKRIINYYEEDYKLLESIN